MAAPRSAHAELPNPPQNLEIGHLPDYCHRESPPAACADGYIYYLDQARASMGLGPYALPADFLTLTPAEQLFILSDLDRIAYSQQPVEGLVAGLDTAAAEGARQDADPEPGEAAVDHPMAGWSSNWAGFSSLLESYFFWMYADGYPGGNRDCQSPTDPGCWGHRQGTLWTMTYPSGYPDPYIYSMGAAATTDIDGHPSFAMTITSSEAAAPPLYYYTWAQAQAEGAGTNAYPAALPVEERADLTIGFRGHGTVTVLTTGADITCHHMCTRRVTENEPVTLRARSARGYRLGGWQGCAAVHGPTCATELTSDQTLRVRFLRRPHKRRHRHRPHFAGG